MTTDHQHRPHYYDSDLEEGGISCTETLRHMLGHEGYVAYVRGTVHAYNWRLGRKPFAPVAQDVKKMITHLTLLLEHLDEWVKPREEAFMGMDEAEEFTSHPATTAVFKRYGPIIEDPASIGPPLTPQQEKELMAEYFPGPPRMRVVLKPLGGEDVEFTPNREELDKATLEVFGTVTDHIDPTEVDNVLMRMKAQHHGHS